MDIVVFGSVTARLPRTPSTRPQRASCATSTTTTPSRAGALRRSRAGSTSKGVATRKAGARWGRSTVRQMLRNPTYRGTACFGKTRIVRGVARRKRVTRKLQQSDLGHLGIRDRLMSEADQTAFTQKACCPPARLRCAAVGLASTDLERSRGMVQHRASAAGVGRPCSGLRSSPNAASDDRSWRPIAIASSCCIAGAVRWPSRNVTSGKSARLESPVRPVAYEPTGPWHRVSGNGRTTSAATRIIVVRHHARSAARHRRTSWT